jgi:hypothetical protein
MVDNTWRKSNKCEGGSCVELALIDGDVHVRDAAEHELAVSRAAWREFVEGVKLGEFDVKR